MSVSMMLAEAKASVEAAIIVPLVVCAQLLFHLDESMHHCNDAKCGGYVISRSKFTVIPGNRHGYILLSLREFYSIKQHR